MLTRIYFALWAAIILAFAVTFAAGALTPMAVVVFGFLAFGMCYMGMISVLPTAVHEWLVKH